MAKYRVSIPNPSHVEPTIVIVEASRMEVYNGMVQLFKESNRSHPCAVFPITVHVTRGD